MTIKKSDNEIKSIRWDVDENLIKHHRNLKKARIFFIDDELQTHPQAIIDTSKKMIRALIKQDHEA